MTLDPNLVEVYTHGLCFMSVCVPRDATVDDVEMAANHINPTGIASMWRKSDDSFAGGQPNPCPCSRTPATHMHYLLSC